MASNRATAAVVQMSVDGRLVTDDVVMETQLITACSTSVRSPRAGTTCSASTPRVDADGHWVIVARFRARTVRRGTPEYAAVANVPVLYGRNIAGPAGESGPYQNAVTDSPLVAWHEDTPATTPGHRHLRYSIVWSNEDGGTSTPALMARWGRTTDIEWVYAVDVDAEGQAVPGTARVPVGGPRHRRVRRCLRGAAIRSCRRAR